MTKNTIGKHQREIIEKFEYYCDCQCCRKNSSLKRSEIDRIFIAEKITDKHLETIFKVFVGCGGQDQCCCNLILSDNLLNALARATSSSVEIIKNKHNEYHKQITKRDDDLYGQYFGEKT